MNTKHEGYTKNHKSSCVLPQPDRQSLLMECCVGECTLVDRICEFQSHTVVFQRSFYICVPRPYLKIDIARKDWNRNNGRIFQINSLFYNANRDRDLSNRIDLRTANSIRFPYDGRQEKLAMIGNVERWGVLKVQTMNLWSMVAWSANKFDCEILNILQTMKFSHVKCVINEYRMHERK